MPPMPCTGIGTPFGWPVVPDVKMSRNGSAALTVSAGMPRSRGARQGSQRGGPPPRALPVHDRRLGHRSGGGRPPGRIGRDPAIVVCPADVETLHHRLLAKDALG